MINDFRNDNIPNLADAFATDLGAKVEPTAGEKASGWLQDNLLPATKLNWLLDRFMESSRINLKHSFGAYRAEPCDFPGTGIWVHGLSKFGLGTSGEMWVAKGSESPDDSNFLYSLDGFHWSRGAVISTGVTSRPLTKALAVTVSGLVVAVLRTSDNKIAIGYTTDVIAGSVTTQEVYVADFPRCIAVANSGDRLMIGDSAGAVHTAASAGSGWVRRVVASGSEIADIKHVTSTIWVAVDFDANLYLTTDNGSSWSLSSQAIVNCADCMSAAVSKGGRVVVMGREVNGKSPLQMSYSDDYINWTECSIQKKSDNLLVNLGFGDVINLGGSVWLANVNKEGRFASLTVPVVLISTDDGVSWAQSNILTNDIGNYFEQSTLAFDRSSFISVGGDYALIGSNNYV